MCGYSSYSLKGISRCSLLYSHFNTIRPICRKAVYHPFHWCSHNNFGANHVYIKAYFLNQCNATTLTNLEKKRMKTMIVKFETKLKSKIMLGVIRNLVLDFILYFVTAYLRKCLRHVTSAQGATQNTLYIIWGSKKSFMTNNLQQYNYS